MDIELTIKNYRCFPESKPVRIIVRKGFSSFVGVNNSGKSSLLKFFYEFRNLFQVIAQGMLPGALSGTHQAFRFPAFVFDPQSDVFFNGNNHELTIQLRLIPETTEIYRNPALVPKSMTLRIPRGTNTFLATLEMIDGLLAVPGSGLTISNGLLILGARGAIADLAEFFQAFDTLANTLYIGPFRNALNVGTKEAYFDINVGQAFVQSWGLNKTGVHKRYNEVAYKVEMDIKRIFGFANLQINPSPNDETLQVLVNGRSYNLFELGSGLTQFIVVLANAALDRRKYILIDEPELNLHPSLQLDFLTTLGSYATEGVLFATHSIGLARVAADWRYSVRRSSDGTSEVTQLESTPRLSEFLGDLGFSGYRDLGFGKVLLVEGKTDVKAMQQLLRVYGKDHTVVPLPLGGHTLINDSSEAELAEITRLCDEIYAVIDSERSMPDEPVEPQRERFKETCTRLGINCHILERRAIENYFSPAAVRNVRGEKYEALKPYESVHDAWRGWSKTDNWRIAREMTLQDLNDNDLGNFLNSL